MATTAFASCAVTPAARNSLSDVGMLYSIPSCQRPQRKRSSTILGKAGVSERPPVWCRSPKRPWRACGGSLGGMRPASMTSMSTASPHAQPTALVHDTKQRLRPGHLPVIFTDAYEGYESAILDAFGRRYPAPAQGSSERLRRSILRWPQGLAYGQVKKQYKGRGMERVEVRVLYGKARGKPVLALLGYQQITPSVIARPNGTSRLRNQRKVRKTLAFSKVPRYHRWMRWLAVGLYHFCREHRSFKSVQKTQVQHRSPAMAAR